jgi:hypothetical protein
MLQIYVCLLPKINEKTTEFRIKYLNLIISRVNLNNTVLRIRLYLVNSCIFLKLI